MKILLVTLSLLTSLCSGSFLYAGDKVVVIPLGKSVQYTTKTFHYNLPLSAFTSVNLTDTSPRVNYIAGEWLFLHSSTTIVGLAAPVQLPDGAELTDFTCYAYDNEGTEDIHANSPVHMWRRAILTTDRERITTEFNMATTGSSSLIQSFSASSIDYPSIDNSLYFYGAYALFKITEVPATANDIRFYGCRITYTLDVVTP